MSSTKRTYQLITIGVLLLFGSNLNAQKLTFPPFIQPDRSSVVTIGLKGGFVLPHFYYSDAALKGLPHNLLLRPAAGITLDIPIENWQISPQAMYYGMGMSSTYIYKNEYEVQYLVYSNYLDLRASASYRFRLNKKTYAYAFISPGVGVLLNGNLSLTQPGLDISETHLEMTKANMNDINIFISSGVGVQYYINMPRFSLTIKLETGYNFGILNTFSNKEIEETALPTNVYAYNNTGKRYARGVEILASIGLPLKFDKLKCNPPRTGF